MLYIFDATEKLIETLPEGSFFDAVHREVLNGENTFEFTIPAGSEYVIEGNLVGFRDLDSYWQVFEIKRLVDQHGDGLTRTAYCEHIFYELLDDIVTDKRPSADATAALAGMLENTRWQVGIVDDLGAASTSAYYISALEAVQKVVKAWQGELNWRCVISGGVITRYVDLRAMVGTDTGKQFAYSKDILNIEREEDISGIATALYGRGKGIELDSGSYGRRLTFADVVAPDKPAGQEWIGDSDALAQWGRPGGRHRFDVFTDEEETDPEKLLEKTRAELARRKVPWVTYRLDVVSLEELTGYEHEKVRKGDLVRVIDREFKPELVVSARVVDIERDPDNPDNTKVVLGSFAPTIIDATINTQRRVNDMANRPYNTKWLDGKIDVLQNAIENTQSYVFQTGDDGILILDAATYDQATQAMKLGGGIFAIANQKDGEGGWNWRTFGDGSGFTADLITAGTIDAGLVQIGHATTFEEGYDPVDNHLYFQYSVDGTSWHDVFNSATDKYMRQKVGISGTWTDPARIVGEDGYTPVKGTDYFDGEPGQNGVSSYLWVRYSQNANGNPMTTDPTNAKYIGVATTITSSAPTSYSSYSWTLIKGQDGLPGEGIDGKTSYLHIKYSNDGTTFTGNSGEDVGDWIGTYVDFTQADSMVFSDYTWNKVKGEDGQDVRKFTSQPAPPYGVGDLWIKSDGNTFVCILARETGVYTASDWRDVAKNKFNAPGYVISTPEGIKVFDNNSVLRVLLGSWLKDAIRKYGIKIIDGEIYSGIIRTGGETDTTYIQLISPNLLQVFSGGKKQMEIDTVVGGRIQFYNDGTYTGDVRGTGDGKVFIYSVNKLWLLGQSGVDCQYGINVTGGTKNCIEDTIYGRLAISARESPEVRYIDEGMGTLANGECRIDVDPIFMECIEPHTPDSRWYIQLTPYADVDLYVAEIGDGYFVVKEQKDGTSTGAEFTWSLSATRKDYALIRFMEVFD